MYQIRQNGRRAKPILLEDIISERRKGKSSSAIAEALTSKYGINITANDINNFLRSLDPPKGLKDFDSPERHRYKLFTLDDIISERKKGKKASEIAEALTIKYGINITASDINHFLKSFDPPKKLSDFDSPERSKFKLFTLEDIITERKKGKSSSAIAEALTIKYSEHGVNITEFDIINFLRSLTPPRRLRDFDSPEKSRAKFFTLDDIITERKKGKSSTAIAEALTSKYSEYGVNITAMDIIGFLRRLDPPRKLSDFDSPERHRYKLFTLDDIISERKLGKKGSKIAEALTNKYGINITVSNINDFLRNFDPPKKLSDFDSPERHRSKLFTLDDIITERKKGKKASEIAEALTIKYAEYGVNITDVDIKSFLSRLDPPKKLSDFDSSGIHRYKLFTLDDIITEREKGKSAPEIAEALTIKYAEYGVNITDVDINNFLYRLDPPKSLKDFDSPEKSRTKLFTLDDIITERKKGKKASEIAEALTIKYSEYGVNITEMDIYSFLRSLNPPRSIKEFGTPKKAIKNPLESRTPFQNTVSTSIGLGSSMAIAKVLDMKYPTMSGTKRSLIAGGVPAGVSLGIYAKTKDEAALWGLAGSVIGTALSAYLFKK